jgi:hypothetical protein
VVVVWCLCACGRVGFDARVDSDARIDAGIRLEFGAPTKLVTLSDPLTHEDDLTLTSDLLEIYFLSNRAPDGLDAIYVATRNAVTDPFGAPQLATALDSTSIEQTAELSSDGLTMYLASSRAGSVGGYDVYVTTRSTLTSAWAPPSRIVELSSAANDVGATPRSALELTFTSDRDSATADYDIYFATRSATTEPWAIGGRLAELDDGGTELTPFPVGATGLWFVSDRSGNKDLYFTTGPPFAATPITSINTAAQEEDPWLSPDGSRLFFASDRDGSWDLYEAAAL